MKIKKIELYNFGSYEGRGTFDLSLDDPSKRIVIVGGKNGAGKTTLFTAIQLCLYGNYAFGYKNSGKTYLKEVYNLINNKARLKKNERAYINVVFQHNSSTECSEYEITRSWNWDNGEFKESLSVFQDGAKMEEEEMHSFQNYLIHLIPPDLLKLYFFDGEKIADYFLSDNKINIREALMILSGNDTFDILYNNVHRVLNQNKNIDSSIADQYLSLKNEYLTAQENLNGLQENYKDLSNKLENAESELEQKKIQFAEGGGLTLEQLSSLQLALKDEEEKRERINGKRKEIATDILPFIILHDLISQVTPQIEQEEKFTSYQTLKLELSSDSFREILKTELNKEGIGSKEVINRIQKRISEALLTENWENFIPLFQLSNDEKIQVQSVLKRVEDYDRDSLKNYQKCIEDSLRRSKDIRAKIQNSDTENIEEYIRDTTKTEDNIKLLQTKIEQCEKDIEQAEMTVKEKSQKLESSRKSYENELKKASVTDLSGRVLLLLEDLQSNIYSLLIKKVEKDLKLKLGQLMQKQEFFDDIKIDNDFNVHIIRNQSIYVNDLVQLVQQGGQVALRRNLGDVAVDQILKATKDIKDEDLIKYFKNIPTSTIVLPVEIDKEYMSSGEKQIFVMSLYWALMQQSENDLPYIIDTPFARIDTEHRANITEHFFMDLKGQLFILSTNEELGDEHLKAMENQIEHIYMLEYGKDKRTTIFENKYFEV